MKPLISFIILILTLLSNAKGKDPVNKDLSLAEIINTQNIDKKEISVLIDKSDYRLYVLKGPKVLKEYPVVFGINSLDDKLMQGDRCTPEGKYNMVAKYPHKDWSKFIWINYPTNDSWKKYKAAKKEGRIPNDAKIGGEVGIHGGPKGMDYLIDMKYNWTLGCIALKNKDLDELYPFITKNTVIEIRK